MIGPVSHLLRFRHGLLKIGPSPFRLLAPSSPLKYIPSLYPSLSFETAIGLNGRIYLKTKTVRQSIGMKKMIEALDGQDKFEAGRDEEMQDLGGPEGEVWTKEGFGKWIRGKGFLQEV